MGNIYECVFFKFGSVVLTEMRFKGLFLLKLRRSFCSVELILLNWNLF